MFFVLCFFQMESDDDESAKHETLLDKKLDEIDALPPHLRYNNFDLSCTIISILTYIFDLVSSHEFFQS